MVVLGEADAPSLFAVPSTGIAPFSTRFSVSGVTVASVSLDFDGDGVTDFAGTTLDDQTFTYTLAGLYFPTVTIDDGQGHLVTLTTVIAVETPAVANAKFQAIWNAFISRLAAADQAGALNYLSPTIQPQFARIFQASA